MGFNSGFKGLIDEGLLANNTYVFLIIIIPTRCTNFSDLFLEWNSWWWTEELSETCRVSLQE